MNCSTRSCKNVRGPLVILPNLGHLHASTFDDNDSGVPAVGSQCWSDTRCPTTLSQENNSYLSTDEEDNAQEWSMAMARATQLAFASSETRSIRQKEPSVLSMYQIRIANLMDLIYYTS